MTASPAVPDAAQPVAPRGRLFRKYLVSFVTVISVALIAISAIDGWFSYSEQKRLLIAVQREQANSAATKIAQFAGEIERQIGWLAQLPQGVITRDDLRIDAIRLLRLVPAIAEVAQLGSHAGAAAIRVAHLAQVRDALAGAAPAGQIAADLNGQSVLSVHATVPSLGWLVFVELPIDEAYAPIYASALRSVVLLFVLLACAILAALLLSRRMTIPILALTQGAARIGSGDLEQRLAIRAHRACWHHQSCQQAGAARCVARGAVR